MGRKVDHLVKVGRKVRKVLYCILYTCSRGFCILDFEQMEGPKTPPGPIKWPFDPETPERFKRKKARDTEASMQPAWTTASARDGGLSSALSQPSRNDEAASSRPRQLDPLEEAAISMQRNFTNEASAQQATIVKAIQRQRSSLPAGIVAYPSATRGTKFQRWRSAGDVETAPRPPPEPVRRVQSDSDPSTSTVTSEKRDPEFLRWAWFEQNKKKDERTRYYTGIHTFETMAHVYDEIAEDATKLSPSCAAQPKKSKKPRQ